jgi:hypothetical protein
MGEYVSLPEAATPGQIAEWTASVLACVAGMPPKRPKSGKP